MALADVALAVDCVICLLAERCKRRLFAIDVRLTKAELVSIGARQIPKNAVTEEDRGGGRSPTRTRLRCQIPC